MYVKGHSRIFSSKLVMFDLNNTYRFFNGDSDLKAKKTMLIVFMMTMTTANHDYLIELKRNPATCTLQSQVLFWSLSWMSLSPPGSLQSTAQEAAGVLQPGSEGCPGDTAGGLCQGRSGQPSQPSLHRDLL